MGVNEKVANCVASFLEAYASQSEERLQDWVAGFAELAPDDKLSVWAQLSDVDVENPEELQRAKEVHRLTIHLVLPNAQALAVAQGEM